MTAAVDLATCGDCQSHATYLRQYPAVRHVVCGTCDHVVTRNPEE